jgi:DNA ligase (NAD+)
MDHKKASERVRQLKEEIKRLNVAYFTKNTSLVPESVRDSLKRELIELETAFPELVTPDSPTQRVGAPLDEKLPKVKHIHPKESLQDAFSRADMDEWIDQMKRALGREDATFGFETELKIDGLNMSLVYALTPDPSPEGRGEDTTGKKGRSPFRNGLGMGARYVLLRAVTRGNGVEGEDVTHTVKTIESVPLTFELPKEYASGEKPNFLEIGGEVYIEKKTLEDINKNLQSFSNTL